MVHPGDTYNLCLQYLSTTYLFWTALVRWFDFSSAHGAVRPQISADMSKFIFYILFLTKAFVLWSTITIPKTNIAPEIDLPKRKGSSSNHPFLGAKVRCGECIWSLRYDYIYILPLGGGNPNIWKFLSPPKVGEIYESNLTDSHICQLGWLSSTTN